MTASRSPASPENPIRQRRVRTIPRSKRCEHQHQVHQRNGQSQFHRNTNQQKQQLNIMDKQAVNIGDPPQTVCRMLTLLLQFYKYIDF